MVRNLFSLRAGSVLSVCAHELTICTHTQRIAKLFAQHVLGVNGKPNLGRIIHVIRNVRTLAQQQMSHQQQTRRREKKKNNQRRRKQGSKKLPHLTIEQQQQQIKEARGGRETFSESAVAPDCYRSRAIFPFFRDMLVNHVGEFDNIELSLNYLYFFKKQKQKNPFLARFQHRRHNNQVHSEVF